MGNETPRYVLIGLIVGMLCVGTLNTVMSKLQNSSWSIGIDGKVKQFSKPWCGADQFAWSYISVQVPNSGDVWW